MIPDDEDREILLAPRTTAVIKTLTDNKLLGNKSGQAFIRRLPKRVKRTFGDWI
ncbi:MAG: hypothetical protein R2867_05105 [Caldilineaceae bacterium]